jgi:hypothetical protein
MKAKVKDERRHLTYALAELAKPNLDPKRREVLEAKAAHIAKRLATRCTLCGRPLTDATSIARGYGPECIARVDPREFVTEQETVESLARDYGDDVTRQRRDHETRCIVCHKGTWRLDAVCEACVDAGVSVRRGA